MKFWITILFLSLGLYLNAQEVKHEGKTYEIKKGKIFLEGKDVTDTFTKEEIEAFKVKIAKAKEEYDKVQKQEKEAKKLENQAKKAEKAQKKAEKELKRKEKAQSKFDKASKKLEDAQSKYEKLKKKGKLSPNDEAKWLEKIEKLKENYDKSKKEAQVSLNSMQDQLKIAYLQSDLIWEDPKQNRKHFKQKIEDITKPVDVILLPEMFTTGFTMNAKDNAETMAGKSVEWMQKMANNKNAAVVGSLIIEENNAFYNRLCFVEPDGTIHKYDKRHTFSLAGEDKVFSAGSDKLVIDFRGWKICPLICYDLRFPVWSRNIEDYDLLLYVANWPKPRIQAWDALLKARAIENMTYCIGVNRIGVDEKENEYCGHSAAYDVLGNVMLPIKPNKDLTEIVTLERSHITFYRNKLRFLNDKDRFTLE